MLAVCVLLELLAASLFEENDEGSGDVPVDAGRAGGAAMLVGPPC